MRARVDASESGPAGLAAPEAENGALRLAVSHAARVAPDALALLDLSAQGAPRELTFSQLAAEARAIVSGWGRHELLTPLTLNARLERDSIVQLLAAFEAGRAVLPLHPRLAPSERRELVEQLKQSIPARALLLLATSGSTGTPKIVALSASALLASADASAWNLGWRSDDRWLLCMPLAHAGGASVVTRCLVARKPVVLLPRFDPESVLGAIERHGVTLMSVVPTMLDELLAADQRNTLARLRVILIGGASCPPRVWQRAIERRLNVLATYGCTEMGSQVATQRLAARPAPDGLHSGPPLPGVELRIASVPPDGAARGSAAGNILLRGPMRMLGYVGGKELGPDAWLDSGDVGFVDARGFLHVLGRTDDLIITGGENVHPAEVERALGLHPGVAAVTAFGLPDRRLGEIVAATLVLCPGQGLETVLVGLDERLAPFKRPRRLFVVEGLPVTANGKPDRRAARALALAELADPRPASGPEGRERSGQGDSGSPAQVPAQRLGYGDGLE